MKNNEQLQKDVQEAIKWEPLLNAAEIGVTTKDGVVTLTGIVNSYKKKLQAENAAKNVVGVKVVVVEIKVIYDSSIMKNDTEIANEIINAWRYNWEIPSDKIKVKVENGWVFLDGELNWNYEKEAAKNAIENLSGIIGINNNITIKSVSKETIEKNAVKNALARSWSFFAEDINVDVNGTAVTLSGIVHSIYEKDEAGRLAWNAPGVDMVYNELAVM